LVSRQTLALLPEFHNLTGYLDLIPGPLQFVVTPLDSDLDFIFQPL